MPATVSHVLSATTPDDPSFEIRPSHWNSVHAITLAQNWQATGNTTQSTSGSGDGMFISGVGLASVGVSNNSLIISVPAGAPSPVNFSAGTTSNNLPSVVFSDSNGIGFGLNGSTITGSHNGLTSQSNQAFSAQGGSSAFQTLNFANANGFTFSNNGGSVQGSYTVPAAFSAGISGGNTSGDTGTVSNRIVFAGGNNITVSGSTNAGGMSVTISGAAAGGAQTGISGIVASDTTYTSGTVSFSNQNGVTIGSSVNGATQYVRLSVANQSNQTGGVYVTAQSTGQSSSSTYDARSLSIVPDGIISAGWSNGSFRISATQSNQAWSGSNASSTFQTLSFNNANGVSWSNNAGAVEASYTRPVVSNALQSVGSATGSGTNTSRFAADDHVHAGVFSMGMTNAGNTAGDTRVDVGRFVFQGGNNVTLSQITAANALNTIVVSAGAAGGADGINALVVNAGASTISTTLTLSNSNNVSFGHAAGVITATASFAAQTNQTGGIYVTAQSTGQSSSSTYDLRTLSFVPDGIISAGWSNGSFRVSATQSNQAFSAAGGSSAFQTLGFSDNAYASWTNTNGSLAITELRGSFFATSNTTQSSSGTINLDSIIFQGAGVASVGVSNGSVVISVPSGGGGLTNINVSAGTTSQNLSNIVFSNSNGVSYGLNGSTITGSVGNTTSGWNPFPQMSMVFTTVLQASLHFQPFNVQSAFQFDRLVQFISYSQATNSTLTVGITYSHGLYTKNASTLSLLVSTSGTFSINGAGTNSSSNYVGIRHMTLPWTTTIQAGNYYAGVFYSTSTAGANATLYDGRYIQNNVAFSGILGAGSATSNQLFLGLGDYSTTFATALPASVAFSHILGTGLTCLRPGAFSYASGTV